MNAFLKNNIRKIGGIFFVVFVVSLLFLNFKNNQNGTNLAKNGSRTVKIELSRAVIYADVVDTPALVERGLSGKEKLLENYGMWFVFPFESNYGFWMKDMKFSIDIIWIDKNFKVVDIKEKVSPDSYPEVFFPKEKALYVLEINSGFVEKAKIKIGQRINLTKAAS